MLLPWFCKCCSRGSTGCPPPDLHLATTCCAQADSCPVACPFVCTWEAHPSALAMQAAWLWSHHAFPPLYTFHHSLPAWFSFFQATKHLNKILKLLKFPISEAKFWFKCPWSVFAGRPPGAQIPGFTSFPHAQIVGVSCLKTSYVSKKEALQHINI